MHYFDDLNAAGAALRRSWHAPLLKRWVIENRPGTGPGWDAYPTSRRIVNWIKFDLRFNALPEECRDSMAVQVRWLRRRLEYDLLGNHLLANAKALVHAGLYFSGAAAQGWYALGLDLMVRQLSEQILPDGGHFERSTMYHALVLEDVLDTVNILHCYGRTVPPQWRELILRMRNWLGVMTHPDGDIAFFNDAAFKIAPTHAALEAYAQRLALGALPDSCRASAGTDAEWLRATFRRSCHLVL